MESCHFIFLKKEAVNFSKSCLHTIHYPHSSVWWCRVTKVMLPPVTSSRHTSSYHLSCLCDQMSCEEVRVCARLLFAKCFHRVGGCVGGRRRGGVSSEVGIPEQKNTQQKKGLPRHTQAQTCMKVAWCPRFNGLFWLKRQSCTKLSASGLLMWK